MDSRGGAEGKVGDASPFAIWNHKDDEHPKNGSRDYLWYMGWTARMRRFRLKFGDADGSSENSADSRSNGGLMRRFGGQQGKDASGGEQASGKDLSANGPEIPCMGIKVCDEQIKPLVSSFDSLFLH